MLRNLSAWHLVVVGAVVVLMFGANKLPELARGVGQSMRIFKSEMKDLAADTEAPAAAAQLDGAAAPAPVGTEPEHRPAA